MWARGEKERWGRGDIYTESEGERERERVVRKRQKERERERVVREGEKERVRE